MDERIIRKINALVNEGVKDTCQMKRYDKIRDKIIFILFLEKIDNLYLFNHGTIHQQYKNHI